MLRCLLVIVCMVVLLCMQGCSQSGDSSKSKSSSRTTKVTKVKPPNNEPPFSFGKGKAGDMVRSTELIDLDLGNGKIVYTVEYPALGLTSVATLGYPVKETKKEVFQGRWTVVYHYDDAAHKYSQLPTGIDIYKYVAAGDNRGQLINNYTFDSITKPGKAKYVDKQGKSRTIDVGYFSILPAGP